MITVDHGRKVLTAGDLRQYLDQFESAGGTDSDDMIYNEKLQSIDFVKTGAVLIRVSGLPEDASLAFCKTHGGVQ